MVALPMQHSLVKASSKYKAIAELGQGGMANVFLAVARGPSGFNKLVVLKSLRSDISVNPEFMEMFLSEARLAARLNHPHVVQTYEVGDYAGRPVIVMEYLEGQTLANVDVRAKARLSLPMRLRVLIDALEGLHHAHELTDFAGKPLGIVHRDVSPQNVFVTFDGQVKVLDFGIAKVVSSQVQTATGILKGKVRYMAPEQMLGSHELDRRADLYAIGVMMWEAMAGRRMWQDASDVQVMSAVTAGNLPRPSAYKPDVHPGLEEICMRAMAPDPADRFATALEMASALEVQLEELGTASSRQLGQLVRELFADLRAQTQATIEAQLLDVAAAEESGPQVIPSNLVNIATRISEESPTARPASGSIVGAEGREGLRSKRRSWIAAGVAVAAVAGVIATAILGLHKQGATDTQATSVSAAVAATPPSAPSAPPSPPSFRVDLSTIPRDATLFVNGERLPRNPFTATWTGDSHVVRAEASGYATRTLMITPDHDTDVILALDPILKTDPIRNTVRTPRPTTTPGSTASTAPASTSPPASAVHKSDACSPPYFVDADGIKHFKPECLAQ
jgi:eukaryotic-like serine/threonine-protein kinase